MSCPCCCSAVMDELSRMRIDVDSAVQVKRMRIRERGSGKED
jgi:hypothetical protein